MTILDRTALAFVLATICPLTGCGGMVEATPAPDAAPTDAAPAPRDANPSSIVHWCSPGDATCPTGYACLSYRVGYACQPAPVYPGFACVPGGCAAPEVCVWHRDADHMTSCGIPGTTGSVGWLIACRTDADCVGTSSPLGDGGPTPLCSYVDMTTPPSLGSCWR